MLTFANWDNCSVVTGPRRRMSMLSAQAQTASTSCAADNCRFNPMLCWPCVDDQRDSCIEFIEHVLRRGWTDSAETIRTRRCKWFFKSLNDFGKDWMRADSQRNCIKTSSHDFRNDLALR